MRKNSDNNNYIVDIPLLDTEEAGLVIQTKHLVVKRFSQLEKQKRETCTCVH